MTYLLARVSAACALDIEDHFLASHRRNLRLEEKGGKELTLLFCHKLGEHLGAYIGKIELTGEEGVPLFSISEQVQGADRAAPHPRKHAADGEAPGRRREF